MKAYTRQKRFEPNGQSLLFAAMDRGPSPMRGWATELRRFGSLTKTGPGFSTLPFPECHLRGFSFGWRVLHPRGGRLHSPRRGPSPAASLDLYSRTRPALSAHLRLVSGRSFSP